MPSMTQGHGSTVGLLDERYVLGAVLGEGASGRVYAARDISLGIDVAVKVMHDAQAGSRSLVARFAHEASVSARMLSPHVVKVLGRAVTRSGAPCIVYERLEGETLASFIARRGTLTVAETAEIVRQTARALARVHALGVVHRDVKPENLFIVTEPNGHALIKLLDFGVAETIKPGASSHELVGTPEYMAPEILFGGEVLNVRVDLYALGVVAFECLTGQCPFNGARLCDVFTAVQRGTRPSVAQLRPDISAAVDEWIDCALQPDPYWRFSSAKAMAIALETAATAPGTTMDRGAGTPVRRAA